MGRPAFLVDNLLNPRIYSGHTLTASTTATGKSVRALSAGRRRRTLTGWFAETLNTDAYVQCIFDQPRAFDCIWIDRDHNLAGESVGASISDDDFTTFEALTTQTVPARSHPNSRISGETLIRTQEGALLWYVGLQVAWGVRVNFPAMGAGLRPELAGLMVGKLWRPEYPPIKPFDYARPTLIRSTARSAFAQSTGSDVGSYRSGRVHIKTASFWEAMTGELPIDDLYLTEGHGMVSVHDDEAAERAVFGFAPGGAAGFEIRDGWSYPQIEIPISEEDPVIR